MYFKNRQVEKFTQTPSETPYGPTQTYTPPCGKWTDKSMLTYILIVGFILIFMIFLYYSIYKK